MNAPHELTNTIRHKKSIKITNLNPFKKQFKTVNISMAYTKCIGYHHNNQ